MNCWERLDIQPTSDKRVIKKNYARLLRQYHPEDDPEGFQLLKEAYDEAMVNARYMEDEAFFEEEECEEEPYSSEGPKQFTTGTYEMSGNFAEVEKTLDCEESSEEIDEVANGYEDNDKCKNKGKDKDKGKDKSNDDKENKIEELVDGKVNVDVIVNVEVDVDVNVGEEEAEYEEDNKDNYEENDDDYEYSGGWYNDPQIKEFMDGINELYEDYEKRIDIDNWKELFISNTIWDLDVYATLSHRMIGFLGEHRFIPLNIWRLLGLAFDWEGKEEELRRYYENETVDKLLGMIKRSSYLEFAQLTGLEPTIREEYLKLRDEAYRQINTKNDEEALKILDKARELFAGDPDLIYIEASIHQACGRQEQAYSICSIGLKDYPSERKLVLLCAKLLYDQGLDIAALEELRGINVMALGSEITYEFYLLKMKCYLRQHKYEQARENLLLLGESLTDNKEINESAKLIYKGVRRQRLVTAILKPWSESEKSNYTTARDEFRIDFDVLQMKELIFKIVKGAGYIFAALFVIGLIFSGGGTLFGLIIAGRFIHSCSVKRKKH